MTRIKRAELTSGIGALVLGTGIGSLFAHWFAPAATAILIAGVFVHGFGMWDKRRLESASSATDDPSVTALYWLCWLLLFAVLGFLAWRAR
jgi:hypothetical protein